MLIILQIMLCLFCLFLILVIFGAGKKIAEIREDLEAHGVRYNDHERTVSVTDDFKIPDAIFQKELNKRLEQEKAKRN